MRISKVHGITIFPLHSPSIPLSRPYLAMESHRKRLLARTVDERAKTTPNDRFAVIAQGPELSDGFQTLSMKDVAAAVNALCWWIESTIGPAQSRETLAYMGCNDVRYFLFMLACQKTGYQVRSTTPTESRIKIDRPCANSLGLRAFD